MAFPTIQGRNESAQTGTATAHTVNLPASIAAGELLIVIIAGGGTNALQFGTVTGWTELLDENQTFGAHVWCRQADGTEGATQVFTSGAASRSAHLSYRISGAENPGTQLPQLSAVAAASSNAPNPNTVTPTGGAKDYLFITFFVLGAAGEEADDDTWVNNAATNYSNLVQKTSGTGGTNVGAAVAASDRTNNAASEDAAWPAASTDVTTTWRSFTIAVHPATAENEAVNPVDSVGITDFIDLLVTKVIDLDPDEIGITDTTATEFDRGISAVDNIGITDTADLDLEEPAGENEAVNPVDNIGITDDVDLLRDAVVEGAADDIGITDTADLVKSLSSTSVDPIGITDSAVTESERAVAPVDPVGITDSVAVSSAHVTGPVDPVGITDTASVSKALALQPVDPVGITDAVTISADRNLALVDPIGITDSAAVVKQGAGLVEPVDPVGITDDVDLVHDSFVEGDADPVGITDSASLVLQGLDTVDSVDPIGITDTANLGVDRQLVVADAVGIVDSAAVVTPGDLLLNIHFVALSPVFIQRVASAPRFVDRTPLSPQTADHVATSPEMVSRVAGDNEFVDREALAATSARTAGDPALVVRSTTNELGHGDPGEMLLMEV
jgi:hypothetical protein